MREGVKWATFDLLTSANMQMHFVKFTAHSICKTCQNRKKIGHNEQNFLFPTIISTPSYKYFYFEINICVEMANSFSAKGNIVFFANNTDSGESARNELSHLKSVLFAF